MKCYAGSKLVAKSLTKSAVSATSYKSYESCYDQVIRVEFMEVGQS